MLTTLELRWFYPGLPPEAVERWFDEACPGRRLGAVEEREDLYLYLPECDYLNIKLRHGSLEVKWRKAELGVRRFGSLWEGRVEMWHKWTCEEPQQQALLPPEARGNCPWIGVKKARSQREYRGVSSELTQLQLKDEMWWSVAFEMVGGMEDCDRFTAIVTEVSETYRGMEFLANCSYAYPRWLSLAI
jgi:hypothetical protein